MVNATTHSEVSNLDIAMAIEQDVVQFDVSVHDANLVHVCDALHNLLEKILGASFRQFSPFAHIV